MNTSLLKRRHAVLGSKAPLFYEEPVHLVRGEGVWVYDQDGKRYLDAYNNVPVVGHCHPHVVDALTRQAQTLNTHTRYLHETIVAYGERLVASYTQDDIPFRTALVCTGSEANELALRMTRHLTGKQGIICTNLTYHGNTEAVFELATIMTGEVGAERVMAVPFPERYRPLDNLSGPALKDAYVDQVRRAIADLESSGIGFAGLLMCPILANEGLPYVPDGYWSEVAQLVREAGGLLIFDEVQSGFGRTGSMWGYSSTGVLPDIATMGKPMGNGHPLAGMVARADIFDQFQKTSSYFNTFGGNPVSCAVGMAVLDVLENERLVENAETIGRYLYEKMQMLQDRFEIIGDVRHYGLFIAVELVTDRQSKQPATAEASSIVNGMKKQGVLLSSVGRGRHILKIRPPLPFQTEHADLLIDKLEIELNAL